MVHSIESIQLIDKSYRALNKDGDEKDYIDKLSKINIFVGENNSGKSRLIRSLISEKFRYYPNDYSPAKLDNTIKTIFKEIKEYIEEKSINVEEITKIIETYRYEGWIDYPSPPPQILFLSDLVHEISKIKDRKLKFNHIPSSELNVVLDEIFNKNMESFDKGWANLLVKRENFSFIYMPILRGLLPLNESKENKGIIDYYDMRIRGDYFNKGINNFSIFTGLTSYISVKKYKSHKLSSERKKIKDFENYLSKNFFNNQQITITPYDDETMLYIKIGDEKDRPIFDLGDGIQSIIIMTLPLFLNKGLKLLIFIEEPELLLHPGLQRKLIETFINEEGFENFQFFLTTHSNHFLDITLDFSNISIYSLKKKFDASNNEEKDPTFVIENLAAGDPSPLRLLGVRNSSVFLSNCTIWVEGITDRLYFKRYLELYQQLIKDEVGNINFNEDYHYSFVEYSGNNITHWSFLGPDEPCINVDRLCARLFLISDMDEGKEKRHEELKKILGDRFYLLSCREVENLLSEKVILNVVKDYEKADSIEDLEINLNQEEYQMTPIGEYIENKLGQRKKRKGSYATDSGTIADKTDFCIRALKYIKEWDDLSKEAQKLTKLIYQFIKENNSND